MNVQAGPDRYTPLHLAVEDGGAESALLLIEAGADLGCANRKLQTPLHLAALSQSIETVELLLKKGADPNTSDADGRTPLHCAIVKVGGCVKWAYCVVTMGEVSHSLAPTAETWIR